MVNVDLISQEHVTSAAEMVPPSLGSNELGNEKQDVQDNSNPELLQTNLPIEVTSPDLIESDVGGDKVNMVSVVKYNSE